MAPPSPPQSWTKVQSQYSLPDVIRPRMRLTFTDSDANELVKVYTARLIYLSTGYNDKHFCTDRYARLELPGYKSRLVELCFSKAATAVIETTLEADEFFTVTIMPGNDFNVVYLRDLTIQNSTTLNGEILRQFDNLDLTLMNQEINIPNAVYFQCLSTHNATDPEFTDLAYRYQCFKELPLSCRLDSTLFDQFSFSRDEHRDLDWLEAMIAWYSSSCFTVTSPHLSDRSNIEQLVLDQLYFTHDAETQMDIRNGIHFSCTKPEPCPFLRLATTRTEFQFVRSFTSDYFHQSNLPQLLNQRPFNSSFTTALSDRLTRITHPSWQSFLLSKSTSLSDVRLTDDLFRSKIGRKLSSPESAYPLSCFSQDYLTKVMIDPTTQAQIEFASPFSKPWDYTWLISVT